MSLNDPQINIDNFDDDGNKRNWLSAREIEYLMYDFLDNEDEEMIAIPLLMYSKKE